MNMRLNLFLLQSSDLATQVMGILPLILIFGIFYFLVFLPMQRQKKQTQEMLNGLQNGNVVVTSGGIIGTIEKIQDNVLTLRVRPDGIKMQVTRSAVASLFEEAK
jgi:preprotein translocase subunit YajC